MTNYQFVGPLIDRAILAALMLTAWASLPAWSMSLEAHQACLREFKAECCREPSDAERERRTRQALRECGPRDTKCLDAQMQRQLKRCRK